MDSLGIDNNTREIVWKITPKPKATKPKAKANAAKTKTKTIKEDTTNVQALVEAQIKSLSSILFEKIQELEQDVKQLNTQNTLLEQKVATQQADHYTVDSLFEPWYL